MCCNVHLSDFEIDALLGMFLKDTAGVKTPDVADTEDRALGSVERPTGGLELLSVLYFG